MILFGESIGKFEPNGTVKYNEDFGGRQLRRGGSPWKLQAKSQISYMFNREKQGKIKLRKHLVWLEQKTGLENYPCKEAWL